MSDTCDRCHKGGRPLSTLCDECAALPPVRSEPLFSISRFRSVLVKHGIIFPEAIEDAEGFDGERTLAATRAAYDELMENIPAERRDASKRTPPAVGSASSSEET